MSLRGHASTAGFAHQSVMQGEVVQLIRDVEPRWIADGTVGGAGHAEALLEACPAAQLIGLDRDPAALAAAAARLARFGSRARLVHSRFSELPAVLAELGLEPKGGMLDAVLVDLGVSSHQLDVAARGFSFRDSGPLDMRMDPTRGETVEQLIARLDADALADVIYHLGEERYARRIARAIVAARPHTTGELADVVRSSIPHRAGAPQRIDPATRTFQALRMQVNDELGELDRFLAAVPDLLADGGVVVVIAFHSLEDRAVKRALRAAAKGCICPPELPVCVCGHEPTLKLVTKGPLRPSAAAVEANPRARSAKLRAARRLGRAA